MVDAFTGFQTMWIEVGMALIPFAAVAAVAQVWFLRLSWEEIRRLAVGTVLAIMGLAFFLQGVQVGFMPVGEMIGTTLAVRPDRWILIPFGVWLGMIVTLAEPSVRVLVDEVDHVSVGAMPKRILFWTLALGVGVFVGIAMARIIWNIPLAWILLVGYLLAFALVRFVEPSYTAVAFDAAAVATGPVTVTFVLAVSVGVASATGGQGAAAEGFGLVALVALAPIISVLVLGVVTSRLRPQRDDGQREGEKEA